MNSFQERNRRILVIDDTETIHKDFHLVLDGDTDESDALAQAEAAILGTDPSSEQRMRFELDSAFQGQEGLEKVRRALQEEKPYAMAFVDVRMPPGWDGIETIQRIWQIDPELQVVICTAFSDYSLKEIIKVLGMTEKLLILKKPFDAIEVYQLAIAITEKWHLSRQARMKNEELHQLVKQQTRQIRNALEEAKRANEAKSRFLANMSHEIRTPMNVIIGFGEMLAEEAKLTPTQKQYIDIICIASKNLLTITDDILDFSKIEAGKLNTEHIECSLAELLENLDLLLRPASQKKGIVFEILPNDNLPTTIWTDPLRVRQCLINLVNNAIKFTEKGRISINVSLVDADEPDKHHIRFEVKDTGIGIEKEKIDQIFDAFTQADSETTRRFGGTGLGLTITRQLVGLLGGTVTVSSEPGKGSVFCLTIPAKTDRNKYLPPNQRDHDLPTHKKKEFVLNTVFDADILVAEDSLTNQVLIKAVLEKMGSRVTLTKNGQEAVLAVEKQNYDLVFMDIQMPVMNGYEATEKIRAAKPDLPIIALTANAMPGDSEKCINAGASDYLRKPLDREYLLNILKKYIPLEKQLHKTKDLIPSSP